MYDLKVDTEVLIFTRQVCIYQRGNQKP